MESFPRANKQPSEAPPQHSLAVGIVRVDSATGASPIAPGDTLPVDGSTPMFVWNAIAGATYHITLTNAEGGTVWQASTSDTAIALPTNARVLSGATYYWTVDALRDDGSSATSGVREFKAMAK